MSREHKEVVCGGVKWRSSMVGFLKFINNDVGTVGAPQWLVLLTTLSCYSRHPLLLSSSASCEHIFGGA
jgi:hypothetical protein